MSKHVIHVDSTDLSVAFDCEADRAKSEGFTSVEKRQRATALHVRNAVHAMQAIAPEGYSTVTQIIVKHVPTINPVCGDEYRR